MGGERKRQGALQRSDRNVVKLRPCIQTAGGHGAEQASHPTGFPCCRILLPPSERTLNYARLEHRRLPQEAVQGPPWTSFLGGVPLTPLGPLRGFLTGKPRRGPTGPAVKGIPRQGGGRCRHPEPSSQRRPEGRLLGLCGAGDTSPLVRIIPRSCHKLFFEAGSRPGKGGTPDGESQTSRATFSRGGHPLFVTTA